MEWTLSVLKWLCIADRQVSSLIRPTIASARSSRPRLRPGLTATAAHPHGTVAADGGTQHRCTQKSPGTMAAPLFDNDRRLSGGRRGVGRLQHVNGLLLHVHRLLLHIHILLLWLLHRHGLLLLLLLLLLHIHGLLLWLLHICGLLLWLLHIHGLLLRLLHIRG